jgi:hypothetical protein
MGIQHVDLFLAGDPGEAFGHNRLQAVSVEHLQAGPVLRTVLEQLVFLYIGFKESKIPKYRITGLGHNNFLLRKWKSYLLIVVCLLLIIPLETGKGFKKSAHFVPCI